MSGQLIAAIMLGLAVMPVGWLIRREAQRAKAHRDFLAAMDELRRGINMALCSIGQTLLPAFQDLTRAVAAMDLTWLAEIEQRGEEGETR